MADSVSAMPDRIEIRGLRALGIIGVLPEERERPSPSSSTSTSKPTSPRPARSDDLHDTVDYGVAVAVAEKVVQTEQHLLLERVAQRIADDLLALDRVDGVRVTIRKVRPPLPQDVSTSAVTIVAGAGPRDDPRLPRPRLQPRRPGRRAARGRCAG